MPAEIVQISDYQSKRAIERAHNELEKEAVKILTPFVETESFGGTHPLEPNLCVTDPENCGCEMIPYGGQGIDGMDLGKEPA